HPRLAALPRLTAQAIERDALAFVAVATQQLDILDRQIELVAASVFERAAIVRDLAHGYLGQAFVAADAVVGVDDEVARRKDRQLLEGRHGGLRPEAPA